MVEVVVTIDSTNAELARRWRAGKAQSGDALRALHQTSGRGRNGRSFEAQPGEALLISAIFELPASANSHLGLLTLSTALAMRAAIAGVASGSNANTNTTIDLKWPNDLQINGHKLGGILGELVSEDPTVVVLGCGINTNTDSPYPGATSLKLTGLPCADSDVDAIAQAFVRELTARVDQIASGNTAAVVDEARVSLTTLGKPVRAELASGDVIDSTAVGLDETGALVLDNGSSVSQADITHLTTPEGLA